MILETEQREVDKSEQTITLEKAQLNRKVASLENQLRFQTNLNDETKKEIEKLDLSEFKDARLIIKGCSNKPVPQSAYIKLVSHLQPIAKSVMYGEACSTVPLFKRK